jgi:hypothetical protein
LVCRKVFEGDIVTAEVEVSAPGGGSHHHAWCGAAYSDSIYGAAELVGIIGIHVKSTRSDDVFAPASLTVRFVHSDEYTYTPAWRI